MKTLLTPCIIGLITFSVHTAHSQAKPKEGILSSGDYEIVWDVKIDDRLDNEDKASPIRLVVEKGKISGKAIGNWENRNVVFKGEVLTSSGVSIIVLMASESNGRKHLYVFRGQHGNPLRGQWFWTANASEGGDAILRLVPEAKYKEQSAKFNVEKAIRKELGKPTGELAKADLAKVQHLNFYYSQISDEGLKEVSKLTELKELYMWARIGERRGKIKVTDEGMKEVAKLQKLEKLGLDNLNITDAGMKEVVKLQQLSTLSLVGTQVTDVGMKEVSKLIRLTYLNLTSPRYEAKDNITDEGLKEVAKLQQLKELILFDCHKITDTGIRVLAKLQQLESLNLEATNITKAGVAELQKALPKCKIRHYNPKK